MENSLNCNRTSQGETNSINNENEEESFVILGSSPPDSMQNMSGQNSITNISLSSPSLVNNPKSILENMTNQKQDLLIYSNISYPPQNSISQPLMDSTSIKSMTQEELEMQINLLIQENSQMKENLMQNNNELRREFNKIMKYQEEVHKIHQEHKEKFEETRKLVIKLKTENAMLKDNLKETNNHNEWNNEKKDLLQKVDDLTSALSKLQVQYESIKGHSSEAASSNCELEKQIELLNLQKIQSEKQINLLTSDKENLDRELERNKLEMNIVTERNMEMKATIDNFKVQVANLMAAQHKSETTVVDLNSELKLYKEQLQKAHMRLCSEKSEYELISNSDVGLANPNSFHFNLPSASVDTISRLREEIENLQKQLKEATASKVVLAMEPLSLSRNHDFSYSESVSSDVEKKIQYYAKHLEDIIAWYNSHCKRMNMLQYILKDVQPENIVSVKQVETKLTELQQFSNELCESLTKEWILFKTAQSNFQTIYNEYNNLIKEMESINTTNNVKEEVHQKEIEKLNADISEKIEIINSKSEEIDKKQQELDNVKKEQADIDLLKQQLDVYKEDFEAERKARSELAGEKENILVDLRRLQQRNEELLQRLKNIADVNRSSNSTPSAPPNESTSETTSTQFQLVYPCPLCQFAFYTIRALENHVERCIDVRASM
uniref:Putative polyubiquitin binding domain of nemo n=1 Tax=Xenopsylla cheopis TaxID=163159 RepID=A0A6M2DHJ9_XENCH